MAEIPTMQKITIRLQKVKINNKNYALNRNTNILYDYNLAFKEKKLNPVGKLDFKKGKGKVTFDDKYGRDSMLQMVKSDLDKVNEKARLEQLHREYEPGGPGFYRAEQEFQELVNMLDKAKGGRKNTKRKQKRKRKATRARRGGGRKISHKRRKSKKSSRKSIRRKSIRKGLKRNIEVKGLEGLAKLATSLVGDV